MIAFSSANLQQAQALYLEALHLLQVAKRGVCPTRAGQQEVVIKLAQEIEYFQTSVLVEGKPYLCEGDFVVLDTENNFLTVLGIGEPLSMFIEGKWLEGFLGQVKEKHDYYFYNQEIDAIRFFAEQMAVAVYILIDCTDEYDRVQS